MMKKLAQNRTRLAVLAVLLAELVFLLFGFVNDRKTGAETVLLADAFTGVQDQVVQDTDGLHIPAEVSGYAATSRWLDLDAGLYNVTVAYTGGDASIAFHQSILYIKAGTISLPKGQKAVTFQAYVYAPQEHATLRVTTNGSDFVLQSVTLTPSNAWSWYRLLCHLAFFAALDLVLLLWFHLLPLPGGTKQATAIVGVAGIAFLASVPLLTNQLMPGHDLLFHLNRIEGLTQGMMNGQFPVRIQPFWLMGRGYATSVFYGDLFLYFPALLRFFGVSVQGAYKCYVAAVNLATAALAYYCFAKMLGSRFIGLLGSLLYTLSGYRLISIYTRAAVGEYTAMTFLPLIACGLWLIYRQPKDAKAKPLIWLPAALGYAGLINCHILSCEMAGLLTLITCVVLLPRTLRKNTFFPLVKVVLSTAVLCLGFLVPFFDYMQGDYRVMSNTIPDSLQVSGAFWAQLLGVFSRAGTNVFGYDAFAGTGKEMSYTVGFSLVLGAVVFFLCVVRGTEKVDAGTKKLGSLGFWLGALCLWFSTADFPWDSLCAAYPAVRRLASMLQYVWRFLSPASLLLTVAAVCGIALLRKNKNVFYGTAAVLAVFCIVNWGSVVQTALQEEGGNTYYSAAALNCNRVQNAEYLPSGAEEELLMTPRKVTADAAVQVDEEEDLVLDRLRVTVGCKTEQGGKVTVPLLYYPYYHAVDNATGQELELTHTDDSWEIQVILPANYAGSFTVSFREPWHWRAAELASLLSIAALCAYGTWLHTANKKKTPATV